MMTTVGVPRVEPPISVTTDIDKGAERSSEDTVRKKGGNPEIWSHVIPRTVSTFRPWS